MIPKKAITLNAKQVKALERAWEVLQHGYIETKYNSDPAKRHETRDQAAARTIDELLVQAGYGYDGDDD